MADRREISAADFVRSRIAVRGTSLRKVAVAVGISASHLSRALRSEDGKRPTIEMLEALADELDFDPACLPEYRELRVIEAIKANSSLRDRFYGQLP